MTLKDVIEKLPPELENKLSSVYYRGDGFLMQFKWEDEDQYINEAELTYYQDGDFNLYYESYEKGYPEKASTIIDKKVLSTIKQTVESLGGSI